MALSEGSNSNPIQKEIWLFNPDPVIGSELGKKNRPCVVISNNLFNKGPANLVIIVPLTSVYKGIRSHIRIDPPNGGVAVISYAASEQIRTISKERLIKKLGVLSIDKTKEIHSWILDLIRLD